MSRRERWTILGDILAAVAAGSHSEGARITSITARANIPHDRLVVYLRELETRGLIEDGSRPRLTPEGHEFLREYRGWLGVLTRFGLGEDLPPGPPLAYGLPRAR